MELVAVASLPTIGLVSGSKTPRQAGVGEELARRLAATQPSLRQAFFFDFDSKSLPDWDCVSLLVQQTDCGQVHVIACGMWVLPLIGLIGFSVLHSGTRPVEAHQAQL